MKPQSNTSSLFRSRKSRNQRTVLVAVTAALLTLPLVSRGQGVPQMTSSTQSCSGETRVGEVCIVELSQLRPTQFAIGQAWVEKKKADIDDKGQEDILELVRGPGSQLFLTDGHHEARALLALNHTNARAKVVADWHDVDPEDFWNQMVANNYAFLRDAAGKALSAESLPKSLQDLQDDPFRSLASYAKKNKKDEGCYTKPKGANFVEFYWGDFFRKRGVTIDPSQNNADGLKAIAETLPGLGLCDCNGTKAQTWLKEGHSLPGCTLIKTE